MAQWLNKITTSLKQFLTMANCFLKTEETTAWLAKTTSSTRQPDFPNGRHWHLRRQLDVTRYIVATGCLV